MREPEQAGQHFPPAGPEVATASSPGSVVASVGFWDALSIIVGIVVGTAIYKSPTLVFQNVTGPGKRSGSGFWAASFHFAGRFVTRS